MKNRAFIVVERMDLSQQDIAQIVAGWDGKVILSISVTIFNLQLDLLESTAVPPSSLVEISYSVGSHASSGPRCRLFWHLGPSRVDIICSGGHLLSPTHDSSEGEKDRSAQ